LNLVGFSFSKTHSAEYISSNMSPSSLRECVPTINHWTRRWSVSTHERQIST
jgi:hypothetical protein